MKNAAILAIYYQPAASLAGFAAEGINTAVGYEPQNDPNNGNATVTMAQWDAQANAAGLARIRAGGDLAADAQDAGLMGFLQPDEIDADIITASGGKPVNTLPPAQAAAVEAIYKGYETNAAAWRSGAPGKPIFGNFDGLQIRYHLFDGLIDYARLLKCVDFATCDYHPVQRGEPLTIYQAIVATFLPVVKAAGKTFAFGLVETSNEHLDPTYYKSREPTPAELTAEAAMFQSQGFGVMFFTQSFGKDGLPNVDGSVGGFRYDNTTPAAQGAIKAICGHATPNPTTTPTTTNPVPTTTMTNPTQPAHTTPPMTITLSIPGYPPATITIQPNK